MATTLKIRFNPEAQFDALCKAVEINAKNQVKAIAEKLHDTPESIEKNIQSLLKKGFIKRGITGEYEIVPGMLPILEKI